MPSLLDTAASTLGSISSENHSSLGELLEEGLGIAVGDYLNVTTKYDPDLVQRARVMDVRQAYWNQKGNMTALLVVSRMLRNGKLGSGKLLNVSGSVSLKKMKVIGSGVFQSAIKVHPR